MKPRRGAANFRSSSYTIHYDSKTMTHKSRIMIVNFTLDPYFKDLKRKNTTWPKMKLIKPQQVICGIALYDFIWDSNVRNFWSSMIEDYFSTILFSMNSKAAIKHFDTNFKCFLCNIHCHFIKMRSMVAKDHFEAR